MSLEKFLKFTTNTQIFCEINFGRIETTKIAIFTTLVALNFEFLEIFDIFKLEIPQKSKVKPCKMVKMTVLTVFPILNTAKIDFT